MAQGRSTKTISMIKWIRTSRLSIKKSLSLREEYLILEVEEDGGERRCCRGWCHRRSCFCLLLHLGGTVWLALRVKGEAERETTGYEPFALHAPIQWDIQGHMGMVPSTLVLLPPAEAFNVSRSGLRVEG